ncbi:energy-coupling factor transport system permease protein [Desulfocicer vacuolatum DSM 3385]|uniref:Energy-coupling factor transport system permease protein n=1 Tax=Desulfocicer vacuolatum DSM 3385 TaxID=1121400 RepID=A0A1W2EMZ4_9BACT|nr:energy-coupling factor transporter transmembrane component T [Desulfocicer vacuolatum]SMD10656.1 energy-coupling factor transport system permease protein [Desulfocicer vacuolatum DSM 3385]
MVENPSLTGSGGLDIRSKCALFIQFMVWTVLYDHPACHGVISCMIVGGGLYVGLSMKQMFFRLIPLVPLFVMIMLFTGFNSGTGFVHLENKVALFTLWPGASLTRGGLMLGATFLFRLLNMVVLTQIILFTTPLDQFINLFVKLKLPPALSFLITTAIRFVPALDKKRNLIIAAQRARGIDMDEGSLFEKFKARVAIMIPLMVNAIVISDQLSMALMNRGFGYRKNWTVMTRLQFRMPDYFVLCLSLGSLVPAFVIRYPGLIEKYLDIEHVSVLFRI